MSVEVIGKQIAALRKEKGCKQEELATYVGVSAQAVSKWENGGVPDTELLPKIADFFSVSVDALFGRNIMDYSDLQTAIGKKILGTPSEKQFKAAFACCWDMERSLCGYVPAGDPIEAREKALGENGQQYSSVMTDYGFTRMGIAGQLPYFLLVPEMKNGGKALLEEVDYPDFFKDISDKDVFEACVFLYKRVSDTGFTEKLLVKNLHVAEEKAKEIIAVLEKYGLLEAEEMELDDEKQTSYFFVPTPSFIAFLIFAREMIKAPSGFAYYRDGREKPYLQ